ncbi:MAG TPA: hypothetical protein PLC54_01335, partial [Spirochaetales bacterium]|nr:hypothetical protein [Spirochaetales bacterium]
GGNEWAILNATLSVGEVPVLYLPFFYYPGEEIVFHPVFGYRPREGRFVQTTTYLLGEKSPKDQDISLFKLSESDGGAREVRGVFLRSTGEAAKPASSNFVKIMADLYAGLGTFAGVQAKLDSAGPFSAVSAFLGLGVSRSLFPLAGGTYSPFAEASDWQSQWNQSVLLGSSLPIRYALELSARLKVGPVAFGFSLPLYSDPFFDQDFRDRSEDMAWLKFLKQDKADSAAPSKKSSFSDRIDIQLSIPTSGLPVWLSTLSVGRLSSQLDWASKASRPVPATQPELSLYNADPSREFFYPLKLTLLDTSMSLGGTLLRLPLAEKARAPAPGSAGSDEFPLPEPVAPWASEKPQTPVQKPDAQAVSPGLATTAELSQPSFSPPPLAKAPAVGKEAEPSMSISWSMNPQGRWDVLFLDPAWLVPSDIDWRIKYELRSFRTSGALSLGAQYPASLLDWKLNLSGSTQAQWHANPSSDSSVVSAADLDRWKLEDARYRSDRLAAALSLRATPFASSWMWSASSLSYSLDASLYDYVFKSMDGDSPLYDSQLFSWTRDKVRSHALSALISARPFNLVQSIGVQISLPPLPESYVGRLDLRFPIATFGLTTKAQRPQPEAPLVWDPLGAQLNLAYGEWPSLGANFVWDIEGEKPSSLSTRLAWKGLSAELAFRQASELGFTPGSGWQSTGPEEFQPVSLSMAYSLALKPAPLWRSRINWSLNASLNARQSFIRFTDSTLDVTVGLSFKVHEFLDLQFSSTSRNASLWRYYPDLFSLPAGLDPEPVNPFVDLAKSFNFFDIQDRRESLFKLKSVSIRAVHYLHDWNLTLELTLRPVLDQATLSYQLRTSFSLLLAWISVPEFKASYKKDGSTETWN